MMFSKLHHDADDLVGGFILTEHDFWSALSEIPVQVQPDEIQVLEGQGFQLLKSVIHAYFSALHLLEEFFEF